jgi:hypothetical protein
VLILNSNKKDFKMIIKKYFTEIFTFLALLFFVGCGEGIVDLNSVKYEPKIVIDGYLYPNMKVANIKITRNFPLNQNIDITKLILYSAQVKLTDISNSKVYNLSFNPLELSFGYQGNDLNIGFGKTYRLDVSAIVDGKQLSAYSTTIIPNQGLAVSKSNLDSMSYREKDNNGEVKKFNILFTPSNGTEFHVFSITSLDAKLDNFIYNNAYNTELDSNDIKDEFDRFKQSYYWFQNTNPNGTFLSRNIEWHSIWFYGNYRVILYEADKNFQDFLLTHKNVMEMDGNFHEPQMHIYGDGIGVFGSAVMDTVYFKIHK